MLNQSKEYIKWITDIKSLNIPADSNNKDYCFNVHNFYKKVRSGFYSDSAVIKQELPSKYTELKYLLTNINNNLPPPWTKPRLLGYQRDKELTKNLLTEIGQPDTGITYFLSIGLEHTQPKRRQTLYKLKHSETLKNRIAVMNEYCEHCNLYGEEAINGTMGFMKGEVLATFSKAADGDVVLFDLSQLPECYSYIKRHGDMLLFAKKQH